MSKKTPSQTAKRAAWDAFSRYIRVRDCLATTRRPDVGRCYTCGALHEIGELDAGHFIGGRKGENLLDERGVHAQCRKCNRFLHGNLVPYTLMMIHEYGEGIVDELTAASLTPVRRGEIEWHMIANHYKAIVKELQR